MSLIQWFKRRFFIPGEPITILGFEHNGSAFRFIDGFVRYPNGIAMNRFKDEAGDIKTAEPLMKMHVANIPDGLLTRVTKGVRLRKVPVGTVLAENEFPVTDNLALESSVGPLDSLLEPEKGENADNTAFILVETNEPYVKEDGTYLLKVDPTHAIILDADEKPEGLAFPMDMDTATGMRVMKNGKSKLQKVTLPCGVCKLQIDPVLKYLRTTPELYCVAADVALSAGLLRVKIQWWKTLLLAFFAFLFGMMFHI